MSEEEWMIPDDPGNQKMIMLSQQVSHQVSWKVKRFIYQQVASASLLEPPKAYDRVKTIQHRVLGSIQPIWIRALSGAIKKYDLRKMQ